jgi:hypothetical protein
MLSRLLSDSFWRGKDTFIDGWISVLGIFVKETSDLVSDIGADDVDATSVWSKATSSFVSDF